MTREQLEALSLPALILRVWKLRLARLLFWLSRHV
jgi:hypothetical protein